MSRELFKQQIQVCVEMNLDDDLTYSVFNILQYEVTWPKSFIKVEKFKISLIGQKALIPKNKQDKIEFLPNIDFNSLTINGSLLHISLEK